MKMITRTIETHTIWPRTVNMIDNHLESAPLEPITVTNTAMNKEKALKLVRKKYGKDGNYVIAKIETQHTLYGLEVEKFMELAHVIEKDNE